MTAPNATDLDLGVIGNCQVAGLIDRLGRLVWGCLPRLDGDPAFSALLTPQGGESETGVFAVDLQGHVRASRRYMRNTAVLETLLDDERGNVLRVIDFCPRFRSRARMFRPMMFVRIVEPAAGRPIARIRLRPAAGYGSGEPLHNGGSHHICFHTPTLRYRVTTNASMSAVTDASWFVVN